MKMRLNAILSTVILVAAASAGAETPAEPSGPVLGLSATSVNVSGAPDTIRIDLLRWSSDAERDQLINAWNMKTPAPAAGGRGAGGRAGRGGGRGGGRGAPAENVAPPTPEGTLAKALEEGTTVGYVWSSDVAGYAIRYAGKVTAPDGSERIILLTDKRLGKTNGLWKPDGQVPPNNLDFSVIELRVNAKGEGEGKASLTGKVAVDSVAKMVTLADYADLPVVLKNVKHRVQTTGK
jgi:hypothetical protein